MTGTLPELSALAALLKAAQAVLDAPACTCTELAHSDRAVKHAAAIGHLRAALIEVDRVGG